VEQRSIVELPDSVQASFEVFVNGVPQRAGVDFDQIVGVVLDRHTLRLRRANAPELRIGSLDTPGTLRELAERVTAAITLAANH